MRAAGRWRFRVAALAAASSLACGSAALLPTGTANATSCGGGQSQLQQVTANGQAQSLARSVPVIFVHGINSGAGTWDPQSPGSIAGQVARLRGFTAWTFDYSHESLDWVTNSAIGPSLADAISCLAQASGNQVIIVAHSMGGLAAQYAIGEPGSPAAGHVAELITLGTPYTGSKILTIAEKVADGGYAFSDNPTVAFVEAMLSACAGIATHTGFNPCWLTSVIRAPVGTALESGSSEIQQLPAWPPTLPVIDVAGDMDVFVGIHHFGFHVHPGDGAVTLSSATAHDTAQQPYDLACTAGLTQLFSSPCFHTSLPSNTKVAGAVLADIRDFSPLPAGAYQINRQISSTDGWVLTLDTITIAPGGGATFSITYKNVSSSNGQLTCTGDTDPTAATVTLQDGQVVHSTQTYCSDHPSQSTIYVPLGHSFTDYGIFRILENLAQPFTFYWYAGSLSGTVAHVTLPR